MKLLKSQSRIVVPQIYKISQIILSAPSLPPYALLEIAAKPRGHIEQIQPYPIMYFRDGSDVWLYPPTSGPCEAKIKYTVEGEL